MVTVLGALVLAEKVGIHRWTAVCVGFIGTLIVIRPGLGVMHPAVLLVVVAAGFVRHAAGDFTSFERYRQNHHHRCLYRIGGKA